MDGTYALGHNNRGTLYLASGQLAEAAVSFSKAIDLGGNLAFPHVGRAMVRTHLGDDTGASEDIARAVALGYDAERLKYVIEEMQRKP